MDDMEEKILTRVRASSRRGSGLHSARSCASHVPGLDLTISREHQHETQHKGITDSSDDSMKNVLTTPRHGLSSQDQQTTFAKDMRYLKQLGASILGFKVSDAESTACMGNSQMASDHGCERPGSVEPGNRSRRGRERADFLCALDSCDFNRDSQSAMSTARTWHSHVSQVGVRGASEEDKVVRPESVSNRDLQRAVAVLLKRRSDHVPIREHVHARTEGKHRMSRQLPQDDLDQSAREQSQTISSSSVLCTEGLHSREGCLCTVELVAPVLKYRKKWLEKYDLKKARSYLERKRLSVSITCSLCQELGLCSDQLQQSACKADDLADSFLIAYVCQLSWQ